MEWPSHASPADDTRCPRVLVPGSLEAEQKEWEPSEHSGVGRAEEAEMGCLDPRASGILLKGLSAVLRASGHWAPGFQDVKRNCSLYELV